jgi:hypothetical protein
MKPKIISLLILIASMIIAPASFAQEGEDLIGILIQPATSGTLNPNGDGSFTLTLEDAPDSTGVFIWDVPDSTGVFNDNFSALYDNGNFFNDWDSSPETIIAHALLELDGMTFLLAITNPTYDNGVVTYTVAIGGIKLLDSDNTILYCPEEFEAVTLYILLNENIFNALQAGREAFLGGGRSLETTRCWTCPYSDIQTTQSDNVTEAEVNLPEVNLPEVNWPEISWPETNWSEGLSKILLQDFDSGTFSDNGNGIFTMILHGVPELISSFMVSPYAMSGTADGWRLTEAWNTAGDISGNAILEIEDYSIYMKIGQPSFDYEEKTFTYIVTINEIIPKTSDIDIPDNFDNGLLFIDLDIAFYSGLEEGMALVCDEMRSSGNCSQPIQISTVPVSIGDICPQ